MNWNESTVADLVRLFNSGLSMRQIATELQSIYKMPLTRCAVIGKLHRLRLYRGHAAPQSGGEKREKRRKRYELGERRATPHRPKNDVEAVADDPVPENFDDQSIPETQRKSIYELTDAICHFPVGHPGEEGFFFCGASAVPTKPYCRCHLARAYQPYRGFAQPYIPARLLVG